MQRKLLIVLTAAGALAAAASSPAATLQYFQATGQAILSPGDSPSGMILGYNLLTDSQFYVDPARQSAFAPPAADYFTNTAREIGDNDLAFAGTSANIPLGQLFPAPLGSVQELLGKFANRIYVPSLGGGEHRIKLEFIDVDGAVWNEPAPLPGLPIHTPPYGSPVQPNPIEPDPFPAPPLPEHPPVGGVGSFPATLKYFQATGQAVLLPGQSPSGEILGYNLTASEQFFVDPERKSVFPAPAADYFTSTTHEIGDNDLTFAGTSDPIPLGQLFSTPLGSVEELLAGFKHRIYVPSLGGGEHPINVEFVDLDGAIWNEPAPLPPFELPPYAGPIQPAPPIDLLPPELPGNPPLLDPPPYEPPAVGDVPDIDLGPVDAPPIDFPQVEIPLQEFPHLFPAIDLFIPSDVTWAWLRTVPIKELLTHRTFATFEFHFPIDVVTMDGVALVNLNTANDGGAYGLSYNTLASAFAAQGWALAGDPDGQIPEPATLATLAAGALALAAARRPRRL